MPDNQPVLQVHDTTLAHLDFIEKVILDELIRQGRAEIVSEPATPGAGR